MDSGGGDVMIDARGRSAGGRPLRPVLGPETDGCSGMGGPRAAEEVSEVSQLH